MKPEIERYITKNYYELLKICKKITKNSDWAGDLLNDVILQLYDKSEIKMVKLDDNSIKYYIVYILKINWYSKTSPFFRKNRMESSMYIELYESMDYPEMNDNNDIHKLMEIIETEWAETNWFNKLIFEKYMIMGSLKKVSLDTTIPLTSIKRYVDETKSQIKTNTIIKFNKQ
jgi:hypothetical protein